MRKIISTDEDINHLFERVCSNMQDLFHYSENAAWELILEYHRCFTDKILCQELGVPAQDDDFFFHEAPLGMALRIHHYGGLKGDSQQEPFLTWRQNIVKQMKEEQHGRSS